MKRNYKSNRVPVPAQILADVYLGDSSQFVPNRTRVINRLEKYLSGKVVYKRKNYSEAVKIIKAQQKNGQETLAVHPVTAPVPPVTTDPYEKLERGQQMVNEAIVEIAEFEANKRAEKKVAEVKEKYEKEIQGYQAVLLDAKQSSVIGMLRKHFNNQ